jgi:hypothetical protein
MRGAIYLDRLQKHTGQWILEDKDGGYVGATRHVLWVTFNKGVTCSEGAYYRIHGFHDYVTPDGVIPTYHFATKRVRCTHGVF